MFGYGICISSEAKYDAYARRGLETCAPRDAPVYERRQQTSIFRAYNSILDEAAEAKSNGLVLLHEDTEIRDRDFESKLESEFSDPAVAIIGVIGGRGLRSSQWGQCAERFGRAPDAYYGENDFSRGSHEVDIVDGLLLALSPWAVRTLRFDEKNFDGFHAYDADICMQAKRAGKKVMVADIDIFHHTKGGYGDVATHRRSDDTFRRKWGLPLDPIRHRWTRKLKGLPY